MIPEFSMSRSMSVLGFAALVLVAGSAHSQSAEYRRGYDQGYRDGAAAAGNQSPYPNGMWEITISSALYGIRGARCDARDSLQALVAGKKAYRCQGWTTTCAAIQRPIRPTSR
jgi:hypothetical protein